MIGRRVMRCLITKVENITDAWPPSPEGEGLEGEVKKAK